MSNVFVVQQKRWIKIIFPVYIENKLDNRGYFLIIKKNTTNLFRNKFVGKRGEAMMSVKDFLQSDEFSTIVNRYYPIRLRDQETRWRAYQDELRPYSRAAETAARVTEEKIVRPIISSNPGRFVCFLDRQAGKSFTKSPKSIDDKIFRYLSGRKVAGKDPPPGNFKRSLEENTDNPDFFLHTFFRDIPDVVTDLAGFRITAIF